MSACAPTCLSCLASKTDETDDGYTAVHNGHAPEPSQGPWLVDLFADQAGAHDFLNEPGSFERTLSLLKAAQAEGRTLEVRTWLARPNFRHLSGLPALLQSADVAVWHLRSLRNIEDPALIPRLALAWPKALAAATKARALGIRVTTKGAPLCVLGPMGELAATEAPMTFGTKCDVCTARPSCGGVPSDYLKRFGDEDLRAQRAETVA